MWLIKITRVRSFTCAQKRSTTWVRRLERQRQRDGAIAGAAHAAEVAPGAVERPVFVIGRQDFTPRAQLKIAIRRRQRGVWGLDQIAGDHVDRAGGVGEKDQVLRLHVEKLRQALARLCQQAGRAAPQEFDWLALQFALPGLIRLENRTGRRPERAVVEEGDLRVEQEKFFERVHWGSLIEDGYEDTG
ncbi:MAG: hypothetical protein M5U05_11960 [Anaerolineales bacterium]|nr:hypothetical protein [Anaerolineales bacterium]